MKKFFYIAEQVNDTKYGHLTNLIKRCDSYEDAKAFCKDAVKQWRNDGLEAQMQWVDDVVWGAMALNDEFVVKHMYYIFESPCFMAGGVEGL